MIVRLLNERYLAPVTVYGTRIWPRQQADVDIPDASYVLLPEGVRVIDFNMGVVEDRDARGEL